MKMRSLFNLIEDANEVVELFARAETAEQGWKLCVVLWRIDIDERARIVHRDIAGRRGMAAHHRLRAE